MRVKHVYAALKRQQVQLVLVVLIIASIGTIALLTSNAKTPTASVEPETGTISGSAIAQTDNSASGSKAIQFHSPVRNINDKGYGIAANLQWMTFVKQDAMLRDMQSMGMTWVRVDISWADIQDTNGGAYDWSVYDAAFAKAATYGIKIDGVIDYSTTWANSDTCNAIPSNLCGQINPVLYASYAKAVVQHFGNKLGAVEIWNEPDLDMFWLPGADAAAYTTLLKGAYTAIKSVNPSMLVISGGLSPGPSLDFTSQMYADGAKNYFDVAGYHPYSYPVPPSVTNKYSGWNLLGVAASSNVRAIMAANGDAGKSTWLTEVGAPTSGPRTQTTCTDAQAAFYPTNSDNVDDCLQARIDSDAITVGRSYPWVGVIILYTYQDTGTAADTSSKEKFFGLLRADGSQKPSYAAVKQAIAAQ